MNILCIFAILNFINFYAQKNNDQITIDKIINNNNKKKIINTKYNVGNFYFNIPIISISNHNRSFHIDNFSAKFYLSNTPFIDCNISNVNCENNIFKIEKISNNSFFEIKNINFNQTLSMQNLNFYQLQISDLSYGKFGYKAKIKLFNKDISLLNMLFFMDKDFNYLKYYGYYFGKNIYCIDVDFAYKNFFNYLHITKNIKILSTTNLSNFIYHASGDCFNLSIANFAYKNFSFQYLNCNHPFQLFTYNLYNNMQNFKGFVDNHCALSLKIKNSVFKIENKKLSLTGLLKFDDRYKKNGVLAQFKNSEFNLNKLKKSKFAFNYLKFCATTQYDGKNLNSSLEYNGSFILKIKTSNKKFKNIDIGFDFKNLKFIIIDLLTDYKHVYNVKYKKHFDLKFNANDTKSLSLKASCNSLYFDYKNKNIKFCASFNLNSSLKILIGTLYNKSFQFYLGTIFDFLIFKFYFSAHTDGLNSDQLKYSYSIGLSENYQNVLHGNLGYFKKPLTKIIDLQYA